VLVALQLSPRSRTKAISRSAQLSREAADAAPELDTGKIPVTNSQMPFEDAMQEFRDLALSAGADIVAEVVQRRDRIDSATLLGPGKVEELAEIGESVKADVALFEQDLSPSQLRNLERALPCRVIDRTQLILDIFAGHARTREGQLQVEMAQLEYLLPRLAGGGKAMSQLGGGIGTRGPGETKLETDRRRIRRRIEQVQEQVEKVRRIRRQQRQRRESVPVPTIALVGYTNAGKSTLFNALTNAGVLVSARLFATLDPKLRAIALPSRRRVLLSDTVGFIRNLPPALIASFRATLEEVERAEVLLHVRNAASESFEDQKAEVEKVLTELDAKQTRRIEVWNKIDLLPEHAREGLLSRRDIVAVSAREGIGLERLLSRIDAELTSDPLVDDIFAIPQAEGRVLSALEAGSIILNQRFADKIVYLSVRAPRSLTERYRRFRMRTEKKTSRAAG
jgi:GTP-binding protein HflX